MGKIGDIGKNLLFQIGVQAAIFAVRQWMNSELKKISPGDMYEYVVDNNDLWKDIPPNMRDTIKGFKVRFGKWFYQFEEQINLELIMQWIKDDHPNLFSILINTPNGIDWLDRQISNIKQKLIEI